MTTTVTVNGTVHHLASDAAMPLLYVLRGELGLNGAKYGCGLGQCGACTVLVDGKAVFSCLLPLLAVGGRTVRTIEGLGTEARLSPLQQAFIDSQAAQCGYCIAGMIMRAQALVEHAASPGVERPGEADIRRHMQPNLCRCGTSMRILRAVQGAIEAVAQAPDRGAQRKETGI